jgi:hypothetical protein
MLFLKKKEDFNVNTFSNKKKCCIKRTERYYYYFPIIKFEHAIYIFYNFSNKIYIELIKPSNSKCGFFFFIIHINLTFLIRFNTIACYYVETKINFAYAKIEYFIIRMASKIIKNCTSSTVRAHVFE